MTKHLIHRAWVVQQFDKYLRESYRDVIVHSSIIEGVLVNESGMGSFDSANKFLLCSGKINTKEFCVFNDVRKIRNRLIHDIFKKNKELNQDEIDRLRNDLLKKILESYRMSKFLDNKIIVKYGIERKPIIQHRSK